MIDEPFITLSPRQTFEDNMRPAQLLLRVYRLLESNGVVSEGEMVGALRKITRAPDSEELLLIYNEVFLGLVRERAQMPRSTLHQKTLVHLLRQAVVASCTALETFLPALMRANLPVIIRLRGRNLMPRDDPAVQGFFKDLTFSLDETLRLLEADNAADYIAEKMLGLFDYKYLSSRNGVHTVGVLLGLSRPWQEIGDHLQRDRKELMGALDEIVRRRNDIVHRADRPQADPGGEAQAISFVWTQHAVDAINHVCLALDELVTQRHRELREMAGA